MTESIIGQGGGGRKKAMSKASPKTDAKKQRGRRNQPRTSNGKSGDVNVRHDESIVKQ